MTSKKKLAKLTNLNEEKKQGTDDDTCVLKFSSCDDNKYQMRNLNMNEIDMFIKFAKKIENLEWKNIRRDKGLHYEVLDNMNVPSNISKDTTICSMRLSDKFRLLGYREGRFFYIIWFDRNHETC